MKRMFVLLALALTVSGVCLGQIDREMMDKMGKDALIQGKADAEKNFKLGVYRIESYGMFEGAASAEKYSQTQYGIKTKMVAGCVVTDAIINHAKTYNATMKWLLNKKFQKDIFTLAELVAPFYTKGEEDARVDFEKGLYRLEEYGDRGEESSEEKYLRERYNVGINNHGCMVTDEDSAHVYGYNAIMQELLNKKFGKDIFKEAAEFSKQQNKSERRRGCFVYSRW